MRKHYTSLIALTCLLVSCGVGHDEGEAPAGDDIVQITPSDNFKLSAEDTQIYHFLVAEIANDRDDQKTSINEYIALAKTAQDPIIAARGTSIALQAGRFDDAMVTSKIWASLVPHDIQTQAITVGIAMKTQHPEEALPFLDKIVTKDDEKTLENLSFIRSTLENEQDMGNFVKIMRAYGEAHQDYRVLFMAAGIAQQIEKPQEAMAMADEITAINPGWMRGAALRIQLLYENGQVDKAKQYLTELRAQHPDNNGLKWLQAQMYIEAGDLAQGTSTLEGLTQDPQYGSNASLELARIAIKHSDFDIAQQRLLTFLKTHPDSDEGLYLSAYVYQEQKNVSAALTQFKKVNHGPYYVNSNLQIAFIYARQGGPEKSMQILEPLFVQYPEETSRLELAKTQILLDANHIQEAYIQLNAIIMKNNDNTELRYIRGLIGTELGYLKQAEDDFRFVIMKEPNHLDAINDLAGLLLDQGKIEEAQSYAEQAISLAPNDPEALGHMGWLRYQQGKTGEALTYLQQAQSLSQDPEIATYYGVVLWQKGEQGQATTVWKQALGSNPENPKLIDTMKQHNVYTQP